MKKVFKTIVLLLLSAVLMTGVIACENDKSGAIDSIKIPARNRFLKAI